MQRPPLKVSARLAEVVLFALCFLLIWRVMHDNRRISALASSVATSHQEATLLRRQLEQLRSSNRAVMDILRSSRLTPDVALVGTIGSVEEQIPLAQQKHPVALFTLDRHCGACTANLPLLKHVATTRPCSLEVVGIALNDTIPDQWMASQIGFRVMRHSTGSAWRILPIAQPSTLVLIAPLGRVVGLWSGEFSLADSAAITSTAVGLC